MTVLSIQLLQVGVVPIPNANNSTLGSLQSPSILLISTNDTNATVTTAGYLNALQMSTTYELTFNNAQMALVYTTDLLSQWYQISITAGVITLVESAGMIPGNLVVAGNITSTAGNIQALAGNVLAGSSGHAGTLTSFPATALSGSLVIAAANNAGNTVTTITNASQAAARIYTIPDGGAASNFLLTNNAVGQTIATGFLAVTSGMVSVGSAGNPGVLSLVPTTAANGQFILAATNTGAGNFNSTLTNGTMAQSTVYTIPDPTNAVSRVLVAATATPFTANHSLVASGTGGVIADAGYQMKVVAQAAVAGGAAAQTVMDAFCTAASMVTASWNDTTNAVTIQKVAAGVGQFVVTSSADPGASHLNYIITKV